MRVRFQFHQRRCENNKMAAHDHKDEPKRRRRWGGVFSCCTNVNVRELDGENGEVARKLVRKRVLSGVTWKKKRTVPIETANKTRDCETTTTTAMMTTRRFPYGNKENTCNRHDEADGCSVQITTQQEQRSILSIKSANAASTVLPVHDLNSGDDDHLSKSAPLCSSSSTADTGNCNSPQSSHYVTPDASPSVLDTDSGTAGEPDSSKLLPMLTVAALLVLLFGRSFAVFSMCVYFYMVSRFKSELTKNRGETKKGNDEVDLNSARHKKTVVLRGFLERSKKKAG